MAEEPPTRAGDSPAGALKKLEGPITVEQPFTVDGKRLVVQVTFPAAVAKDIGMEALFAAANRCLVNIESKNHRVDKVRGGAAR
jgi:hypothetical protein